MRTLFLLACCLNVYSLSFSQTWTREQLEDANTARDIADLTLPEKEAIMYINLARMYPKLFLEFEVKNYVGTVRYGDYLRNSPYKKSLIEELANMEPRKPFVFNRDLFENAKCFSREIGVSGRQEHDRKNCAKANYAECLSFGMAAGKDIAMQLLIDHNVPSLGHRKICLDSSYTKIGVSVHEHVTWTTCAVLEFVW